MLAPLPVSTLGFIGSLGWPEILLLALLGVLIFGKRLPEVGKSIGRGIVEFKKGLSGIEDDVDEAVKQPPQIGQHTPSSMSADTADRDASAADTGTSTAHPDSKA